MRSRTDSRIQDSRRTAHSTVPRWAPIALVFGVTCILYHVNGDFLPGGDAKPNVYLPVSLLNEGNLSFSPAEMPFLFTWELVSGEGKRPIQVADWSHEIDGVPARQLHEAGVVGRVKTGHWWAG
jgi:hypothetical protein